ncbi:MAG TPA: hypothetical protein VHQ98_03225 [Gaiellaceae bacterium]|nr:hypothetical protein [Gaiellaceae bacterium]
MLAGQFATLADATAELAGPLVVGLAVAGLLLSAPWRERPDPWAYGAAAGVFAVFAAPIVLSGQATFAGYIKLDDTATYFAMTDRVMEHGRSLAGLAPSTYEATLGTTVSIGYPTGSLMPLGIGHQLLSYDIAWLFQPYLTVLAALLALALYSVLAQVIPSRPLRALAAFVAAQPAILFGYALWGGVKELAGALLLALIAALLPWTLDEDRRARAAVPLAAACAALVCVLSLPGAVWLAPAVLVATVVLVRRPQRLVPKAGVFVASLVVLAIPALVAAVDWLPRIGAFDKETNLGNLIGPLSAFQLFGIWPSGDFRVHPHDSAPAYVLIALVIAAGVVGIWWAWEQAARELLAYVVIAGLGCALFLAISSPWVAGKTLAMASPAALAAALGGCAAGLAHKRVVEAGVAALAIAAGVLWSNSLQYHDVLLAPRGQLHDLETIGHDFAGQGPALMTTYEPYGVRHFLRRLDPEGASELRRRFDYLTNGSVLNKGESADIDRIRLDGLLVYRTLVLRRGPAASRPPSSYRLVWRGRYYEVWQRPQGPPTILQHLPLGSQNQAAGVPRCADVLRLGSLGGTLATATRPEAISLGYPPARGALALAVTVPQSGEYTAWLGGDWRGLASISVDRRTVGAKRHELNWPGLYTNLGSVRLAAGEHLVRIRYRTGGWRPGSGGSPYSFGPAELSLVDSREPVETTTDPRSLCGRRLDWIEAVRR